jgi:hypothetical protein
MPATSAANFIAILDDHGRVFDTATATVSRDPWRHFASPKDGSSQTTDELLPAVATAEAAHEKRTKTPTTFVTV